jgi:hypothetical protein
LKEKEKNKGEREKMFWFRRYIRVLIYEKKKNEDDDGEQTNDNTVVVIVDKEYENKSYKKI